MRVLRAGWAVGTVLIVLAAGLVMNALSAAGEPLVINEIHYNPAASDDNDAEFIEILNTGTSPIDVTGFTVDDETSAPDRTLTLSGTIPAGGFVILTPDGFDAVARWGVTPFATFAYGLSGGGDMVTLRDPAGAIVDEVEYDDTAPWPGEPDGSGSSLELIDASSDNTDPAAWAASIGEPTPGAMNSVVGSTPGQPISGVSANPLTPAPNLSLIHI